MGWSRSLTVRLMRVLCCAPGTDLGAEGGTAVAEAIKCCTQLTDLNLGGTCTVITLGTAGNDVGARAPQTTAWGLRVA